MYRQLKQVGLKQTNH